jgi:hypothetical protein
MQVRLGPDQETDGAERRCLGGDGFCLAAAPQYGTYDSLADVLRQIGDEGVHKRLSLDRLTRAR